MKCSDMVEWFLVDRGVELRFQPNPKGIGKVVPEFDLWYLQDGRRITERTLAMQIMTELRNRNYNYSLAVVIAALTTHAWQFYVANQEYPEWMRKDCEQIEARRPPGRPRKNPKRLPLPDETTAPPVNTLSDGVLE
jgi:hypothetical protein